MTTHVAPSQASSDSRSAAPGAGLSGRRSSIAWIALTSLAPAVWGTTYIVTTHALPPGHPVFAALMRTLPAGVLAFLASRQLPRGTWWWKSIVLGALNMACFFPLLFVAAQRLPGGVAATLGAAQPIIIGGLAVTVLGERLSACSLMWGVAGVVGIALVVLGPQAQLDALGVAAGLGGAVSMGLGVVLTKRWGRPDGVSALDLAGWQLTGAGLLLTVPTLVIDGLPTGIDTAAVAGYAWLGLVGGLAAYALWFAGIRRLPVTPTALLGLLSPLTAALLGSVIAGEALTSIQFLGFALALTAMSAGQLAPHSSRSSSRKDPS